MSQQKAEVFRTLSPIRQRLTAFTHSIWRTRTHNHTLTVQCVSHRIIRRSFSGRKMHMEPDIVVNLNGNWDIICVIIYGRKSTTTSYTYSKIVVFPERWAHRTLSLSLHPTTSALCMHRCNIKCKGLVKWKLFSLSAGYIRILLSTIQFSHLFSECFCVFVYISTIWE